MICLKCGKAAPLTWYGVWCDRCGGHWARPDLLLYRHVATMDGPGGRLAIVFDASTDDYSFIYPGRKNPNAGRLGIDEDFHRSPFLTAHGTLDAMIALAQPVAKGDSEGFPELSVAPSATKEERTLALGV
jgi:hypothetical protein